MSTPSRLSSRAWLAIPLCAFGFLLWIDTVRVRRVEYVSGTAGWSVADPSPAPAGDAGWQPRLVVPGHDNESYEWLDQARQMFARGEWRVRHIDYENAPLGREVDSASPYRWCLGLFALADNALSGRPLGMSLERAALFADPLMHMLLLACTAVFVAWRFGCFPAAVCSIGLVALFPFASEFLPGAPDDHGLAQACAIWSVLPLLAGTGAVHSAGPGASKGARRWFLLAGVAGGIGLWISVAREAPILIGIALGALMAGGATRGDESSQAGPPAIAPWRVWALGGAAASLGACLAEYFPAHLASLQFRAVHPLYGLAWLGGGEVLAQAEAWIRQSRPAAGPPNPGGGVLAADAIAAAWKQRRRPERTLRDNAAAALALLALAALPAAMWQTHDPGFMALDPPALRLARLPDSPAATDLLSWVTRDGLSAKLWAALLPMLLIWPAIWLLVRRGAGLGSRAPIAIALGPVLVALGFACRELAWWNGVDAALVALLVAMSAAMPAEISRIPVRWALAAIAALVMLPGAIQIVPKAGAGAGGALTETEVVGLVERDLARWLALRAGGREAVVLAPLDEAVTLHYFGGLRGLAALGWENRDGLEDAIRIASASTPEEAKELIERHGLTHIVVPSWDSRLDAYALMGRGRPEDTFMARLQRWELPPWLRPVAYPIIKVGGFEEQVAVFDVVEDQDEATAESRLAEYFAEMEQAELASSAAAALRRFPADLGALVGRAQVEIALGDKESFAKTVDLLLHRLSGGADRALPWDRRVGLAIVLAEGQQIDLARMEVTHCLEDADGPRLRALPTGSLYRLQELSRALGLGIADPRLRELSLDLLPPELRRRLEP